MVDHTQTANPCDWLPCHRAALLLVGCPHSLVYLHLPVVEGLIFCISATSICEPPPILPWNLASPGTELGQTMETREAVVAALTFLAGADLDLDGAGSVVGH